MSAEQTFVVGEVPESSTSPRSYCSPGLRKTLERLAIVEAGVIDRFSRGNPQRKVIADLAARRLLAERDVLEQLAKSLGIELVSYEDMVRLLTSAGAALAESLPKSDALAYRAVLLEPHQDNVRIACADPLDQETLQGIEFRLGRAVDVVLASESAIVQAIENCYVTGDHRAFDQLEDVMSGSGTPVEVLVTDAEEAQDSTASAEAPPIVRLVNKVLADSVEKGASDIHLEPGTGAVEVRMRIDGIMRPLLSIPKRLQSYVTSRLKLLASMDISERRRPQDGRFRIRTLGNEVRDIRVSSVPTPYGEKIVMRVLKPDAAGISLKSVGLEERERMRFENALRGSDRIVLVTGPTGSGKTTTLYAALQFVGSTANTVVTVEDPIEYRIAGATQIQVNEKIGVTFASGLRSILRQDPDVILVGEIRDVETAEIAFQAAQTGHLVLSTLHTNDAVSAIIRLRDLGLESFIIAGSLAGVLAQRLVRVLCSECAVPASEAERTRVIAHCGVNAAQARQHVGCDACGNTGFRGRKGVFSFFPIGEAVQEAIREEAGQGELEAIARESGFVPLRETARILIEDGTTTFDEVIRVFGSETIRAREAEVTPTQTVSVPQEAVAEVANVPTQVDTQLAASVSELVAEFHEQKEEDSPRILLIDDDEGVRAVMFKVFQKADFEVVEAVDGQDALNKLEHFWPDLIVCDLNMPGLSGRDFVKEVKQRPQVNEIPILMLTNSDSEEEEVSLIELGASDFVSKSSSPALVITRIRRLLREKTA